MQYSMLIGNALKLPPSEMKILQMGTLVHDIGKIGIPDEILTKPDHLTDAEYRIVKAHAENGARMVENIPIFLDCVPIIRGHHERLNGTGYPNGLKGEEISLVVRIAAVADVFDAMTSNRAYRTAVPTEEAIQVLASMAEANELDPKLVKILTEIVLKDGPLWTQEASQAA
jgi:putative two-component system response regulator